MAAVCERAEIIIVEVNENMPRCLGGFEEGIHISQVAMIVEGSNPAIDAMGAAAPATEVDEAVAKYIVDEIPDGACLQLGIGGCQRQSVLSLLSPTLRILVYTQKCM